ncbi:MAG: hypothetical protein PHQ34_05585 [Methanothrix sp.]|nr:hypothetical protein [Methanothrix sp.]
MLSFLIPGPASGIDVLVGPQAEPGGAVILVVDGLGASYVYPEHHAYALDGSPLEGSVLFNLTGGGARAVEVRVPVPETTKSHSVLITGNAATNPDRPGTTIFNFAHTHIFKLCCSFANDHLCYAMRSAHPRHYLFL